MKLLSSDVAQFRITITNCRMSTRCINVKLLNRPRTGLKFLISGYRVYSVGKGKVKLSLYRPWRPLGLREVEAPTFSDIWLTDGVNVINPTRRLLFTPGRFLVLISVRG
jgi:hypothetical protein